jgi:hypothetical protein
MLNDHERSFVFHHAYVPEHLPDYVRAVSAAEPFLVDRYLCFFGGRRLIFVGYPLGNTDVDPQEAYTSALERFRPSSAAIIAPEIWLDRHSGDHEQDQYYHLALPLAQLPSAVAYMIRRARREVGLSDGNFGREHKRMVRAFIAARALTKAQETLFKKFPGYVKQSDSALLLEARKGNRLAAFSVLDLGSADYGFYLFNFRSQEFDVPGASDLLLHEMVRRAVDSGKRALNLGLGLHAGVRRFKEKWGAVPFLSYASAVVRTGPTDIGKLLSKL